MPSSKVSAEERILNYFETEDLATATPVFNIVKGRMRARLAEAAEPVAVVKRGGKKRHRRTKAEMEAAKAAEGTEEKK